MEVELLYIAKMNLLIHQIENSESNPLSDSVGVHTAHMLVTTYQNLMRGLKLLGRELTGADFEPNEMAKLVDERDNVERAAIKDRNAKIDMLYAQIRGWKSGTLKIENVDTALEMHRELDRLIDARGSNTNPSVGYQCSIFLEAARMINTVSDHMLDPKTFIDEFDQGDVVKYCGTCMIDEINTIRRCLKIGW